MRKLIRPTYPVEINVFIISIIFILSCFFSHEMFLSHLHEPGDKYKAYLGMLLMGAAVVLMVLIVWEEILFPVKVKEVEGGLVFRNHQSKLVIQVVIYCAIPAILSYIYFQYDVKLSHFIVWTLVCMVPPVIEKIVSGINNYYDFLEMTTKHIEYKNNEKVGNFATADIENIVIVQDESKSINKLELLFRNNSEVIIDLDEMELEAFYDSIDNFIKSNYKHSLREMKPVAA